MKRLIAASLTLLLGSSLAMAEYAASSNPIPDSRPSLEEPPKAESGARPRQSSVRAGQATPGPQAWWDDRTSGLIGGIGGSIVGCIGGLIGTLAGLGRARRLALGLAWATIVFGLACLLAGAVAISLAQPYAVWYPLLLGGGISAGVMGSLLRTLRRRYAEIELRRMAAMDVHTGPN
jgi:hypothetical protein